MSLCLLCGKPYVYIRGTGQTRKVCHSCMSNRHRYTLKRKMIEYKGGRCQLCGYDKCTQSLDFHHVDSTDKEMHFGGKHGVSWNRIRTKLDKCVLVCRNCHGEIHEAEEKRLWTEDTQFDVLERLHAAVASFVPVEVDYSRSNWIDHHPARDRLLQQGLFNDAGDILVSASWVDVAVDFTLELELGLTADDPEWVEWSKKRLAEAKQHLTKADRAEFETQLFLNRQALKEHPPHPLSKKFLKRCHPVGKKFHPSKVQYE